MSLTDAGGAKPSLKWGVCVLMFLAVGLLVIAGKSWFAARVGDYALEGFGPADYSLELAPGFALFRPNSREHSITGPQQRGGMTATDFWVEPEVVEVGWNDHFIVCRQRRAGADASHPLPDMWWLIDASQLLRQGPFTREELSVRMRELGVPESIRIRSVAAIEKEK